MNDDWLKELKEAIENDDMKPEDGFERMVVTGIIDKEGRVTGQLHRWDAYLAIEKVSYDDDARKVAIFHCRKPWAGMRGGEPRDVTREALIEFMKQGKKVITAYWDTRLRIWREGDIVYLNSKGFLRIDKKYLSADNLGTTPEAIPAVNGKPSS